jgi:dTDP-4-amino-4,6-dideoxygalactose transaminase
MAIWGPNLVRNFAELGRGQVAAMQDAILHVKLKYLEQWTKARRAAAKRYGVMFAGSGVVTPFNENARRISHLFHARDQAPGMAGRALPQGHSDKHPFSHRYSPAYEDLGCKAGEFLYAEQAAAE